MAAQPAGEISSAARLRAVGACHRAKDAAGAVRALVADGKPPTIALAPTRRTIATVSIASST
jgi:hypothetical protein